MRRSRRTSWVVFGLLAIAGCEGEPSFRGASFELANGVRVDVDSAGLVSLFEGERPLVTLAEPESATFRERVSGDLAIWSFRRSDEVIRRYGRVIDATTAETGEVVVRYATTEAEGEARLIIRPADRAEMTAIRLEVDHPEANALALRARCDEEGTFHGFGEQYDRTDQRGEAFTLMLSEQGIGRDGRLRDVAGDRHTTYFPMPYYLDARGFGVLLTTDHRVEVDVCAADAERARFEVVDGAPIEAFVFHGPRPADVVRQLSSIVGRPAQPPDWAFGLWISKQGGQDAVLAEAEALTEAEIPATAIWSQDWTGVRMNVGGGFGVQYRWRVDADHYPDLGGMVEALRERGYRFLAYANPFIDPNLEHFDEMADAGLLIRNEAGESYLFTAPNGRSSHPDFTRSETDDYVRAELRAMVDDHGIDGWMADFGEWNPLDAVMHDGSDPAAYHNRYPLDWHRVNREAMDQARPDGDYVLFARSGWTGVQRYSMIHWVGDQEADFSPTDGLPTVVPAMINLGLAGVPYVTHDIAGFSGGPSTKELYLRWTELGAFTPIMRTHEGNRRDVNWNWDSDAETIAFFRRFARIHQALGPELEALAREAQEASLPMVRHLALVFPDDRETWPLFDQYMLGDALLVAPVLHEGQERRRLYLPEGEWFHVFTGERFEGGREVEVDAPLGTPPVFSRGADRDDLRGIE